MDNEKQQPQNINQDVSEQNSQANAAQNAPTQEQVLGEQNAQPEQSAEQTAEELLAQIGEGEEEEKKKKLPLAAKIAIGVAAALFLGGGAVAGVSLLGNNNISVVMDYGEVHNNKVVTQTVKKGTKIKSLPILDKEGWIFDGWYKDEGCTEKYNNNTTLNEDVTVYGKYEIAVYVVTFYNDDGSVIEMFTEIEYGTDMTTVYTTVPTKTDKRYTYTFKNWTDASGSVLDLSFVNTNISAYANYDKEYIDYTLTINNGSSAIINVTRNNIQLTEQDKLHYGDELKISYIETDGYQMEQFVVKGATQNGDSYIVNNNVVINYSESVNKFSVIFYDENKTTVLHTINNLEYGDAAVYPTTPTKQSDGAYNYTFAGWTDINGNPVNLNYVTGNMEVYVNYTAEQIEYSYTTNAPDQVTVTKDGVVLTPQDTFHYGDSLVITYTPTVGYYCKQMIVTGATENRTSYIVTGNVNINYIEEIYKFTVTYYDEDKSTILHTITDLEHGANVEYATIPQKESDNTYNYTFDKWLDANGDEAVFTNLTQDLNVYASYTKEFIEYSVTVNNTSNGKVTIYKGLDLLEEGDTVHYGDKLNIYYETSENYVLKLFTVEGATLTGDQYVVTGNVTITYEEAETFTVNYYDYDNSLIYSETNVEYGTSSKYNTIPTREADDVYTYTFKCWTDEHGAEIDLTNVTSNIKAYATYTSEYRQFTLSIQNSKNGTLSVSKNGVELENGALITYNDVLVITYELTEGYSLVEFSVEGATQDGNNFTVTGNVTVIFSEAATVYTVNYYDEDKTTLFRSLPVGHGDAAVYSKIPTKNSDATFTYSFAGWVDEEGQPVDLSCITSNLNVYASYASTYKEYSLTINNATKASLVVTKNGALQTSSSVLHYGDKLKISYTTTEGYTMTSFKVSGATLSGDEYTVIDNVTIYYSEQINEYTVTYYDEDKTTVIYTLTGIDYNTHANYSGIPTKDADNTYTYKFDKWLDAEGNEAVLTNIKQDISVYASYTATIREYTITVNKSKTGTLLIKKDGEEITTSDTVHYGDVLEISYTTTEGYHVTEYSVTGAELGENIYTVTGNVTITYKEDINVYRVNFYDEDQETLLITKQVQHGSATYFNVTKPSDETYVYTFDCWTNFDGEDVDLVSITSNLDLCPKYTATYIEYTVTINKTPGSELIIKKGSETLTASSTVHYGDVLTISYTIREGWEFVSFSVDNLVQDGDNYIVQGDIEINFTEKVLTYNVTIYTTETDNAIYEVPRNLPIWQNLPQLDPMENYTNEEYTCGFYTDAELRNFLPTDTILTGDMTLYTRVATLDKLSFTGSFSGNEITHYNVKAFSKDIPGDVVIPLKRKYGTRSINVTTMSSSAFSGCTNMTSIIIAHNITNISQNAFMNCDSLTELTIPENIKYIDRFAIGDCEKLVTINYRATSAIADWSYVNSNVTYYYNSEDIYMIRGAQLGCKVTIGNNVTTIPKRMFLSSNIIQVAFEAGSVCSSIGDYAFAACENLIDLHIPSTITSIGRAAFVEDVSIKNVYIDSVEQWLSYSMGYEYLYYLYYYIPDHNNTGYKYFYTNPLNYGANLYVGGELLTDLTIPDTVTSINAYAFRNCDSLQTVTIPDTVTTINAEAFRYCSNLNTITIGTGLKTLGNYAFGSCEKLNYINLNAPGISNCTSSSPFDSSGAETCVVNIGDNVTKISDYLFYNSNITLVQFSDNTRCTNIGEYAFGSCYKLQDLTLPSTITNLSTPAFSVFLRELYNNTSINITAGNYGLSDFVNIISLNGESTDRVYIKDGFKILVKDSVYYILDYVGTATDIILPDNIDGNEYQIRDYAFYNNDKIKSIIIPSTISTIGTNAFVSCQNLKKVYISDMAKWLQIEFNNSNPLQNGAELYLNGELVTEITVPSQITQIKDYAFEGCTSLVAINIPQGTSIGKQAFYNCINLQNITTPNELEVIGEQAFYNCIKLKSIELPEGLTEVNNYAFYNCISLTSASLPSTLTKLGDYAFYNCIILVSDIVVPSGVSTVGEYAFYNCQKVRSLTLEQGNLTQIGDYAFYYCTRIVEANIPEGVTRLGEYSFYNCKRLISVTIPSTMRTIDFSSFQWCNSVKTVYTTDVSNWSTIHFAGSDSNPISADTKFYIDGTLAVDVVIPAGITKISSYAFYNCSDLKSISIPDGVTSLGSWMFYACINLEEIIFPEGITQIASYMFYNCSKLKSVTIPSTVTQVGASAFGECKNLSKVYISSIENWVNIDFLENYTDIDYDYGYSNPLYYGADLYLNGELLTNLIIPSTITQIKQYTFNGCTSLKTVVIPEGVTSISYGSFYNCKNLETISFPSSLTSIGYGSFFGCSSLTAIDVSQNVQKIGSYAFYGCKSAKTLLLSDVLTSIEHEAFYNCSNIQEVILPDSVTTVGFEAFKGCSSIKNLVIGEGLSSLGSDSFAYCTGITTLTLPNTLTNIGSAFYNCTGIKQVYIDSISQWLSFNFYVYRSSLTSENIVNPLRYGADLYVDGQLVDDLSIIPEEVTSIPQYAFYGCNTFKAIEIPEHIKSLGNNSFAYCKNLEKVVLHAGLTSFSSAFYGCSNLVDVTIPEGIQTISSSAFEYCTSLRSITLPITITNINAYAFYGCSSLTYINLPEGLNTIYAYAFYGCSSMVQYTLPSSLGTIGDKVFASNTQLKEIINYTSKNLLGGDYGVGTSVKIIKPEDSEYITVGEFQFKKVASKTETDEEGNTTVLEYSYTLVGYTGKSKVVILPDDVDGSSYGIRDGLFSNKDYITSITIPENVTSLGLNAFSGCDNLTRIVYNARNATGTNSSSTNYLPFYQSGSKQGCIVQIGSNVEKIPSYLFKSSYISDIIFGERSTNLEIGSYAFADCDYLTDITIDSKINVGNSSFANCENLTKVVAQSETRIGESAFNSCYALQRVELNGTTSIGGSAFNGCSALTDLRLGSGIETINSYAFYGCGGLVDIIIPEGTKTIGSNAFGNCFRLKSITLPTTITTLGSSVFDDTPALLEVFNNSTSLTIGQGDYALELDVSIVNVGEENRIFDVDGFRFQLYNDKYYLLEYVGSEENVVLPAGIKEQTYQIRQYAFYDLDFIKSVTIPTGVVGIGDYAFKGCDNIETLTIGTDVSSIGIEAFYSCDNLKTVTIDTGLKTIGEKAFMNCVSLEEVTILDGLSKINNYAFNSCKNLKTIILPDGMKTIGSWVFQYCSSLQGINVPVGVTSIGNYVFDGCSSMTYATLPEGLTNIGDYAFRDCLSVQEIVVPEGVTYLGPETFKNCASMVSIYIPTTLRKLGTEAFYNCTSVKSITLPVGVSTLEASTFYNCSSLEVISIPNTVVIISKAVFYGCSSLKFVNLPERITYIDEETFKNCYSLQEMVIPEGVASIGANAFDTCRSMTSVTIPSTVKTIGESAFYNCEYLLNVTIPEAVTAISDQTFYGCTRLEWAEIPETITEIGEYAFYKCSSLEWFIIPEGVVTIEKCTFYGCSDMESIIIPSTVTKIDSHALYNCTLLKELILPEQLEYIGSTAFRKCTSLSEIYIPGAVSYIGNRAFDDCTNLKTVIINNAYVYERSMLMNQGRILESAEKVYILKSIADSIPDLNEYMYSHNYTIDSSITEIINEQEYYEFNKGESFS